MLTKLLYVWHPVNVFSPVFALDEDGNGYRAEPSPGGMSSCDLNNGNYERARWVALTPSAVSARVDWEPPWTVLVADVPTPRLGRSGNLANNHAYRMGELLAGSEPQERG